ncbi:MAG: hypothetical protein U5K74_13460 [Gemmatimonadaceae bacterium]|nr:hypothetical protein [Gemmatimonadaceae bacterium]
MMQAWRRLLVLGVMLMCGVSACGSDDPTDPVVAGPGVSVSGLTYELPGATITAVTGSLPAPTAAFAAPIVALSGRPSATTAATITVSAAEPFQTIFVQAQGTTSYARIFLPAQTTLVAVSVKTDLLSSFVATSLNIAVGSGARTSQASALPLQSFSN